MDLQGRKSIKLGLILEISVAGVYLALTKGVFPIFLVSEGLLVRDISIIVFSSALASTVSCYILFLKPKILSGPRLKLKLTFVHGMERVMWFFIPMVNEVYLVSLLYTVQSLFSAFTSISINFLIYGCLEEGDIKDLMGKRAAAGSFSSVIGYLLSVILIAFLPGKVKFIQILSFGATIGLVSTLIVGHLKAPFREREVVLGEEHPEKIYSASLFSVVLFASSNLLGITWTPYLINHLGGEDYIAAMINFASSVSGIFASLFWRNRSFKLYRFAVVLTMFTPLLVWGTKQPFYHIPVSVYSTFVYTGPNFLGSFIFARHKEALGPLKSSITLVIIGNISQMLAAPLGIFLRENYSFLFTLTLALRFTSLILALVAMPEIAILPEDVARNYSFMIYKSHIYGYNLTIETTKEVVVLSMKFLALTAAFLILYLIYRFLLILLG